MPTASAVDRTCARISGSAANCFCSSMVLCFGATLYLYIYIFIFINRYQYYGSILWSVEPGRLDIVGLQFANGQGPPGRPHHQTRLKHKGKGVVGNAFWLKCCLYRLFIALPVWAVCRHDRVQTSTARSEPAVLCVLYVWIGTSSTNSTGTSTNGLGFIVTIYQPHKLAHGVAVVVGRAKGVVGNGPPRRKDDKVGEGGAC